MTTILLSTSIVFATIVITDPYKDINYNEINVYEIKKEYEEDDNNEEISEETNHEEIDQLRSLYFPYRRN